MDFNFVMGLIKTESSFQVDIISKTNDFGLMQIVTKSIMSGYQKSLGSMTT